MLSESVGLRELCYGHPGLSASSEFDRMDTAGSLVICYGSDLWHPSSEDVVLGSPINGEYSHRFVKK